MIDQEQGKDAGIVGEMRDVAKSLRAAAGRAVTERSRHSIGGMADRCMEWAERTAAIQARVQEREAELTTANAHAKAVATEYRDRWQAAEAKVQELQREVAELKAPRRVTGKD